MNSQTLTRFQIFDHQLKIAGFVLACSCALPVPNVSGSDRTAASSETESPATPDLNVSHFPVVRNSDSENHLSPMAADEAARTMVVPEGFRVSVFAAEPDVQNPIAMAWDDMGRLWVAENYTYSDRSQRFDLSLRDRVLIFEDSNHDGVADDRKVFTDQVQMLTSVEVGRGGVWLMCPPQLLFLPDSDGDDQPDGPAQVVLDGFEVAESNYHNFANGLRWGPDGWLYGRCGHSCPGRIGIPGTPVDRRVPLDGGIWRYHPDRKVVEVLCQGTVNPWGHDWDQHGELFFINTVIGHLWHMLPGSHFKESFGESSNPGVYERMDMIADHYHFDTGASSSEKRYGRADEYGGGHAHIGMMIYQGDHWPSTYHNKLLTLNMHGQRANVERLERIGSGYVGRHEPDFLVSRDPFFRGIDLSMGPDGNVFVIDWSDTGECHEHDGVHRRSGRIFKISYEKTAIVRPIVKPRCVQGSGQLPQLWRDFQAGRTSPESLRTLEHDPDEHRRAWAIRLLTDAWPLDWITGPAKHAVYPSDPKTLAMLVRMASNDSSGLVHRVLASTLQRLPIASRAAVAMELVKHQQHAQDHPLGLLIWFGLIPVGEHHPDHLVDIARVCEIPVVTYSLARNLASQMNSNSGPINSLLEIAVSLDPSSQNRILAGMKDALEGWRHAQKPDAWDQFSALPTFAESKTTLRELSLLYGDGRALAEIQSVAMDRNAEIKTRQRALQTLIDAEPNNVREVCESLIDVRLLNGIAARALTRFDDPEVAKLLSHKYQRFQPEDRPSVIESLVSRPTFAMALLEEIESGRSQIRADDITAAHARQIQSLGSEPLTRKLSEVWGDLRATPADRVRQIDEWKVRLASEASSTVNLARGRVLFQKTCSQCHVLFGEGDNVGPDLTGSQRANLDYLLSNILDPSAVVSKDYRMSVVALNDGRVLNGLVVSHDEKTLILRTATERLVIPSDDIAAIKESSLSAMPDGLLQNLDEHQIRDLVAYLRHPTQVQLPKENVAE